MFQPERQVPKDQHGQTRTKTYRSFMQMMYLSACYNLTFFYFGYLTTNFLGLPFGILYKIFHIKIPLPIAEGALSGCLPLGGALGAFLLEFILKILSRKKSMYLFNGLAVVANILVLITTWQTIFLGRTLQGICLGALSVLAPLIVKQITPIQISGTVVGLQNVFMTLGILLGFAFPQILVSYWQYKQTWSINFGFPVLIILTQQILLMYFYNHQTPKYLIEQGHFQQAKEMIQKIYLPEFHEEIYQQKLKDLSIDDQNYQENQKQYPPDNWKAVFIVFFLAIFQELSGTNILLFYAPQIVAGFMPASVVPLTIALHATRVIWALVALYLLQKFGRKTLMIFGIAVCCFAMLTLSVGLNLAKESYQTAIIMIITSIFIYIFASNISFVPLMWIYTVQVLQPNRAPIALLINWITDSFLIVAFPIFRNTCGDIDCPKIYLTFFGFLVIKLIVCQIFMIETKDKTQREIREQFHEKKLC